MYNKICYTHAHTHTHTHAHIHICICNRFKKRRSSRQEGPNSVQEVIEELKKNWKRRKRSVRRGKMGCHGKTAARPCFQSRCNRRKASRGFVVAIPVEAAVQDPWGRLSVQACTRCLEEISTEDRVRDLIDLCSIYL